MMENKKIYVLLCRDTQEDECFVFINIEDARKCMKDRFEKEKEGIEKAGFRMCDLNCSIEENYIHAYILRSSIYYNWEILEKEVIQHI